MADNETLDPAKPRIRTVMVPVYLSVPVMSDDESEAEFEAARLARNLKMPVEAGEVAVACLIEAGCKNDAS